MSTFENKVSTFENKVSTPGSGVSTPGSGVSIVYAILVGIVIFLCIILVVYSLVSRVGINKYKPERTNDPYDKDPGGSQAGYYSRKEGNALALKAVNEHSHVSEGKYECDLGWYGSKCDREGWDWKYYSFGTPEDLEYESVSVKTSGRRSFLPRGEIDPHGCSAMADKKKAYGFVSNKGKCELIVSRPYLSRNSKVKFNNEFSPTLFLRRGVIPKTKNKVYINKYPSSTLRPYLSVDSLPERDEHFLSLRKGESKEVKWMPGLVQVNNFSRLLGVWSEMPLSRDELREIIKYPIASPKSYFVDRPTTETYVLRIPSDKYRYVIYLKMKS